MACSTPRILAVVLLCEAQACATAPRPAAPLVPLEAVGSGAVEIYGPGLVGTTDSGASVTFALTTSASVVLLRVWPGQRLEQLYPLRPGDTTHFTTGWHTVRVPVPVDSASAMLAGPGPLGAPLSGAQQVQVDRCVWQELKRYQPPASASNRRGRTQPMPIMIPPNYGEIEEACRRAALQNAQAAPAGQGAQTPLGPYLVLVASDNVQDARHLTMRLGGVDISRSSLTSVLQVLPAFLAGADARTWAGYVALANPR